MHPALSVVVFTVASGGGYALLALMGLASVGGFVSIDRGLGLAGFALGFGAVVFGLVSSTFHLGHKERAWRAFSQWRSSWLSREAVLALATMAPAGYLAFDWIFMRQANIIAAVLTAILAALTLASTAMIYASLKPVPAWRTPLTIAAFLFLGLLTGALWLAFLCALFGEMATALAALLATIAAILSGAVKLAYWRRIDAGEMPGSGVATSLGRLGTVRPLLSPHGQANYVMKEMGFQIARKHARKLRRVALWAGVLAPGTLSMFAGYQIGSAISLFLLGLAVILNAIGVLTERWLFFAEAKHVVMAYYAEPGD